MFAKLKRPETLQRVAWPYATFTPAGDKENVTWEEGSTSSYKFRLLGFIPFGTHRIRVIRFSEHGGIYTHECNEHVKVWNHRIRLKDLKGGRCLYTDEVRIGAGWKTVFIYIWACMFYAHRQRKWIKILKRERT